MCDQRETYSWNLIKDENVNPKQKINHYISQWKKDYLLAQRFFQDPCQTSTMDFFRDNW